MTRVDFLGAQLGARVPGGTGRYTAELVRSLHAVANPDDVLRLLVPRSSSELKQLGIPLHSLGLPLPLLSRLWERGLPPTVGRGRRVVHAPTLLVPKVARGAALVVTVHDVVPWTHPHTLTARGAAFHRRMGERAARRADLILTPSRATAEGVLRYLGPSAPVVVLHPGVSVLDDGAADRSVSRSAAGRPFVLFVGTAEPRKGLDLLVRAMATRALSGYELVVAGPSGWGGVNVAQLASAGGVADRVHLTGRVSDAELGKLYRSARVLAVPSVAEGFGLPVAEAMSIGTPVVISDDAALVEVAGGAALVVADRDPEAWAAALVRAATDDLLRVKLGVAGRLRSQNFRWEDTATQLWRLYRELAT